MSERRIRTRLRGPDGRFTKQIRPGVVKEQWVEIRRAGRFARGWRLRVQVPPRREVVRRPPEIPRLPEHRWEATWTERDTTIPRTDVAKDYRNLRERIELFDFRPDAGAIKEEARERGFAAWDIVITEVEL